MKTATDSVQPRSNFAVMLAGLTVLLVTAPMLRTLGYGDISPAVPLARTLAYLEAMIGQLYIAILIAGLVGAHLSDRGRA